MSSARDQLLAHPNLAEFNDPAKFLAGLTDEQCQQVLDGFAEAEADKAALRARLAASPLLRQVACPATSWNTPDARYDVTKTAVAILENTATHNGVTLDELVAAVAANGDGIQHRIELHGTDPRFDGFVGSGSGFYAFRCALKDALRDLKAEETKAAHLAAEAKREAKWAAQGLERCDRCGGAGGHNQWPGFTCFDCGGIGALPAK